MEEAVLQYFFYHLGNIWAIYHKILNLNLKPFWGGWDSLTFHHHLGEFPRLQDQPLDSWIHLWLEMAVNGCVFLGFMKDAKIR